MKLIFIVGKKRSGKDTAVDFIEENYDTHRYKLAYPIKWALEAGWNGQGDYRFSSEPVGFKLVSDDWDGSGIDREKHLPINNQDVANVLHGALNYLCREHGLKYPFKHHSNELDKLIETMVLNNTEAWNIRRLMQTLGTDLVVNHFDRMFWVKLFALEYADNFYEDKEFFIVPDTRQDHELAFARAMGATVIHVVRDGSGSEDTHITEAGLPIAAGDTVIENNGTLEEFKQKIIEALK